MPTKPMLRDYPEVNDTCPVPGFQVRVWTRSRAIQMLKDWGELNTPDLVQRAHTLCIHSLGAMLRRNGFQMVRLIEDDEIPEGAIDRSKHRMFRSTPRSPDNADLHR